ncbi:S9 family peptidase [Robertkochia solimangrovi]|uniref:S9 family peptidase n=1 Tax=Robertkochia solimangrovi TaxID=2213046 RepID=UPI0011804976|nr:S9 family peptidase [Robertkochia solimangrovi]TRZ43709.1 S9 family peptidase [Robertkochia solimangrovi]
MKTFKLLFIIACLGLTGCKEEQAEKEAQREIGSYTIKQFLDTENVFDNSFSYDDSKILLTSNKTGIYNLYTVPSSGGEFIPLTESDSSSILGVSYFPKDDRILFRMDDNGDEVYKIYLKDSTGVKRLTPAENVRTLFYKWAKDNNSFYFASNERDPNFMDLLEMSTEDFSTKVVYENKEGMEITDISDDKTYVVLVQPLNTNDTDIYLKNLKTGEKIKVNERQSGNTPMDFSPDGKWYYYTSDEGSEFSYLMRFNPESKVYEKVTEKSWDISNFYFTHKGTYSVLLTNEDASNKLEVKRTADNSTVKLPQVEGKQILGISISRDEKMAILDVGNSNTPTDLYSYNMESGETFRLTNVLNEAINPEDLVAAEVVRFKSFDDLEIPAIYYKPVQATPDQKVPALVWVHGGPGGQSRTNYSSLIQYLVNHGYAVLAVNNRGSSGYGKTFYQMDDQNHGDKDLKDCIAGKDWLASQDVIDSSKIGILGGSYGGYMTMAALTYAPDEFEVGVNLFGVTNWLRTLKSIPPWWSSFKDALYQEMGDPNTVDSVRLKAISPLFHTDQVKKPLIVLQGSKDPRVLQVESDEIVAGVRKNGVPVEYVLFEDEGHGFVKKENQIEGYEQILNFLDEYLKGESHDPDMDATKEISTE